jgi:hypothetical protein
MDSVHDNDVYGYSVSLPNKSVVLHTQFDHGGPLEYTDVVFSGVALHQFESAGGNQWILSDIVDAHPMPFYERHAAAILGFDVGLTFRYDNVGEFMAGLLQRNLSCFEVQSSIGLRGFVIAERCDQVRGSVAWVAA